MDRSHHFVRGASDHSESTKIEASLWILPYLPDTGECERRVIIYGDGVSCWLLPVPNMSFHSKKPLIGPRQRRDL